MKKAVCMLHLFMRTRIKGEWEYRASFYVDTLSFILGYGSQALLMMLLIRQFDSINGWKPAEVMLLYAYTLASYTLCSMFLGSMTDNLSERIRTGEFDTSCLKPMHPLLYEMITSFSAYYFLHFLLSLFMVALGFAAINVELTLIKLLVLLAGIIGGALIQGGMQLLFSSLSFVLISNPLTGSFYSSLRAMIEYPLTIYPKPVQLLFTFLLPLAFVAFFPIHALTGKCDHWLLPSFMQYLSLPIGLAFFALSCIVWTYMLRKYKSTGS